MLGLVEGVKNMMVLIKRLDTKCPKATPVGIHSIVQNPFYSCILVRQYFMIVSCNTFVNDLRNV